MVKVRGSAFDAGTTNVLRVDCPMVTLSRLRTRRSSTILPFWMMPMRRIFGAPSGFFSWAMSSSPSSLERVVRCRLHDLRQEVLLQALPIVIHTRALKHIKSIRLLDLAFDDDALGDAEDLLPRGRALDLDLGRRR